MRLNRLVSLRRIGCLATSGAIAFLTVLTLAGCEVTKNALLAPSGTQFAEQGQKVGNSKDDKSRHVNSSSNAKTEEKYKLPANAKTVVYKKLERKLASELSNYGDKVAVSVASADENNAFAINGDRRFVSASMIKLLVLAEFIDEIDARELSLDDIYSIKKADIVGGTGVIQNQPIGTKYSYEDLAPYMITYSDNTATNILIDIIGIDAINAKAAELKLKNTELNRKMMDLDSGVENYTSANDIAKILRAVATNKLGSKKMCKKTMGYLQKQTDDAGLSQGLPDSTVFAHKTGSLGSIRHDGGIVECKSPYVIVVLTDIGVHPANKLMKTISSTTYQLLENQ